MQVESLPTWLSDAWGITLESAEVILSITILLAVLLPLSYFVKGRSATPVMLIMLFLTESLLVGIGWLPFWLMIATVAVMAVAISLFGAKMVTGG